MSSCQSFAVCTGKRKELGCWKESSLKGLHWCRCWCAPHCIYFRGAKTCLLISHGVTQPKRLGQALLTIEFAKFTAKHFPKTESPPSANMSGKGGNQPGCPDFFRRSAISDCPTILVPAMPSLKETATISGDREIWNTIVFWDTPDTCGLSDRFCLFVCLFVFP